MKLIYELIYSSPLKISLQSTLWLAAEPNPIDQVVFLHFLSFRARESVSSAPVYRIITIALRVRLKSLDLLANWKLFTNIEKLFKFKRNNLAKSRNFQFSCKPARACFQVLRFVLSSLTVCLPTVSRTFRSQSLTTRISSAFLQMLAFAKFVPTVTSARRPELLLLICWFLPIYNQTKFSN